MIRYIPLALGFMFLTACNSQDEALSSVDDSDIIHVGGVSTDDMVTTAAVTRAAVAAETVDWLKAGLQKGMTINYYQDTDAKQKAQLKLDENGKYSLKDANGKYAKWLGNGAHFFEGVYIPAGLGKDEPHIYDSLSHYTAAPPSTKIAATVGRITIPHAASPGACGGLCVDRQGYGSHAEGLRHYQRQEQRERGEHHAAFL